jgi:hypothetical protein
MAVTPIWSLYCLTRSCTEVVTLQVLFCVYIAGLSPLQPCPISVLLNLLCLMELTDDRIPCLAQHVSIIGVQLAFNCLLHYSVHVPSTSGQYCHLSKATFVSSFYVSATTP